MNIQDIKKFCSICGSIYDTNEITNCTYCRNKLTRSGVYEHTYSERTGVYQIKLNAKVIEPKVGCGQKVFCDKLIGEKFSKRLMICGNRYGTSKLLTLCKVCKNKFECPDCHREVNKEDLFKEGCRYCYTLF